MDLPSAAQPLTPEIRYLYDLRRGTTRLGLASTRRLLSSLGSPERTVPMLHVAGTNGKGSTTAMAAAMLQAGGLRVGRFTSPHILRVEERVCVDGKPIDPDTFAARVRDLRRSFERAGASFFEALTALAAVHFRDAGVDVAVYEVGLGGRLDATNAVSACGSIIASLGHDHEAILGRGLRAVGSEKLGIARRGVPLHANLERPDLVRLAREHCARRRTPLVLLPADVGRIVDMDLGAGMRFELWRPRPLAMWSRFLGAHQVRNAALACLAVHSLRERGVVGRDPDLVAGAARAFLPGRLQFLPAWGGDPGVVLDVGHNPEALHATLDVVEGLLVGERPTVVLALLRDKRLDGAALRLARLARRILLTQPAVERTWDAQAARRRFPSGRGLARVEVVPEVATAVRRALDTASGPVLLIGSHYLLGEAIPVLAARRGVAAETLLLPPPLAEAWRAAV